MKKASKKKKKSELKYRNIKVASEISKYASTILDADRLMVQTVNLIAQKLNFYFVGLYLIDKEGKYANLKAGSGNNGKKLMKSSKKVKIKGGSIVGWSIMNESAGISLSTNKKNSNTTTKLLSKTRSEIAIPLISRRGIIGALNVHSKKEAAFKEDQIVMLGTIADHLTVAIENAWLHEDAQEDIENRKKTEIALKESMSKLEYAKQEWESTANSLPQVICLLDKMGKVIFANKSVEDWKLSNRKNLCGSSIHEMLHNKCMNPFCYMKDFWKKANKNLKNGNNFEMEIKDEELDKFLSIQVRPIKNNKKIKLKSEKQSYAVIIIQDITDRKSSEEMWKRYEFVVNAFKEYMTLIDKDMVYRAVNEAYCKAHEKKRENIVNYSVPKVWGEKVYKEKIKPHLEECFNGNVIYYRAWFKFPALGKRFWDVACYPYCDANGSVPYIVVVSRDITERKKAEAELVRETEIRRGMTEVATRLSKTKGKELEIVLKEICKKIIELIGAKDVYISLNGDVIASDKKNITLPWRVNGDKNYKAKKVKDIRNKKKPIAVKIPSRSEKVDASILVYTKKDDYHERDKELLKIIGNTLSLALEVALLEDKSRKLKNLTDKVIFMDSEDFQSKAEELDGKSFYSSYLVADIVDSVKQKVDQTELQRLLKSIVIRNGAIWCNSWGDMIHAVFSDYFLETKEGYQQSAYKAAIEICEAVKKKLGFNIRIGLSSGRIRVNKDTIQMDQLAKSRIIEKASIAQEGRVGITTIQKPSKKLTKEVHNYGYEFKKSKDLVRGEIKSVWKIYPVSKNNGKVKISEGSDKKKLNYEASLKILLTKGVCSHGHFEGGNINTEVIQVLKKVYRLYKKDKKLQERFYELTGKKYNDVYKALDEITSWGESRKKFDFSKHFLPWLFLMKLGEASSPELIYELTKAQFKSDLGSHAGITREISPTVWLEMGFEYDQCIAAFTKAIEDVLKNEMILGPINIGVGVKRYFLTKYTDKKKHPFTSEIKYPYLKCMDLISALRQSSISKKINTYVNVIDIARSNPLFNYKGNNERAKYTKHLYKEADNLGAYCHVHLLEEIVDKRLLKKNQKPTYELDFIINLFRNLRIKNARLIHMAYWQKSLPFLKDIIKRNYEIVVCHSSTQMLGASHKPRSPFLLKNKNVIKGIINDESFPRVLIGTDDSGPFNIRNVWEEMLVVYNVIQKWHSQKYADLALVQFLRNSYNNKKPLEISKEYSLDSEAVRWVQAYDIFRNKKEIEDSEIAEKVSKRVEQVLIKRENFVKK